MNKIIKRTHTCGELSLKNLEKNVSLNGWISKRRDLGGLIFFDLSKKIKVKRLNTNNQSKRLPSWFPHVPEIL